MGPTLYMRLQDAFPARQANMLHLQDLSVVFLVLQAPILTCQVPPRASRVKKESTDSRWEFCMLVMLASHVTWASMPLLLDQMHALHAPRAHTLSRWGTTRCPTANYAELASIPEQEQLLAFRVGRGHTAHPGGHHAYVARLERFQHI